MNSHALSRIVSSLKQVVSRVALCGLLGSTLAVCAAPQPTVFAGLHKFPMGFRPYRGLTLGPDNVLYGCTARGGNDDRGTVYRINRDGTGYAIIHHFSTNDQGPVASRDFPGPYVIRGRDGLLYGITHLETGGGKIFKLNRDGSGYTVLHTTSQNQSPFALMQGNDDVLYGGGLECVFRIDTDGGNFATLHTFDSPSEGSGAMGRLVEDDDGNLYGTCYYQGPTTSGTIFKLNKNGAGFTVLHSFTNSTTGGRPYAGLTLARNGKLYGVGFLGGSNNLGVIFRLNTDGSDYTILHHFGSIASDGFNPAGELLTGLDGFLYGTTTTGGSNMLGSVFRIGLEGNGYEILYSFVSSGNALFGPGAWLVQGPASNGSGILYGTTLSPGAEGVFALIVNPPLSIAPTIRQSGGDPAVFWPAWALNYQLETTTDLVNGEWVPATNGIQVIGFLPTNVPSGSFFRLVWPE